MRSRTYCYTSFKESEPFVDINQIVFQIHQLEICETTGRPHWQGIVAFPNAKAPVGVKQYLCDTSAHIEYTKNIPASIAYCTKEETRVDGPFSYGTVPDLEPDNWWQQLSDVQLWTEHSKWMLRNYNGVAAFRKSIKCVYAPRATPTVILLFGETGSGKSRAARELAGDELYPKPMGAWWDGYRGHRVVLFDDFYGNEQYSDLLRWLSELPISVPYKGGFTPLLADRFFFTSNAHPRDWYPNIPDKSALWRRVTKIYECFLDRFLICDKKSTLI
ncbi:replication associated protein [Deer faeces associated circular DNA virus 1]|uniref:replication associated protein n=1 Tax=Deer faeces associated circular DNA virus 1 TaxID=1843767 RepID=UPI0007C1C6FA|nr:replication associated protein [Deer faeces associated circular DNA virus 1]ANC51552.1 replication associated protein [Deer faeces associated circular DNA virus 1]